ncbi:endonuclease domain-containing protein [Microbacterium sp. NPDC003461]
MSWYPADVAWSYRQLRDGGMTRTDIENALATGRLFRARRNVYLAGDTADDLKSAARVGGRLDCLSALRVMGVFVQEHEQLHVQIEANRKHLRSPRSRRVRLKDRHGVRVHWRRVQAPDDVLVVDPVEALILASRCQPPRSMIATLDSALHQGIVTSEDLDDVFAALPGHFGVLRRLVDSRAESGPESLARLELRGAGWHVAVQQWIDGVGRTDLVVERRVIVECDSREHHSGWEAQERDRARDLAAAERGFATVRPTARMIFDDVGDIRRAVAGLLAAPF